MYFLKYSDLLKAEKDAASSESHFKDKVLKAVYQSNAKFHLKVEDIIES